jgi:prolyl oligopeptidase
MTAYGGFGVTLTPQFSVFALLLLELGFIFAIVGVRGGGERGLEWHLAARGRNRQRAFDDFIVAAEWLCSTGAASPSELAMVGGSNSGLLVAAVMCQRPLLFRAVLCIAPLLDMIRYHLFDHAMVWAQEYGTADDKDDFAALIAYSPYHQVRTHTLYPSILFISGDADTRCNPAHARKMTALLQEIAGSNRPVLLDCMAERGHSPVMPLSVRVDSLARRISFLCDQLGVPIRGDVNDSSVSSRFLVAPTS